MKKLPLFEEFGNKPVGGPLELPAFHNGQLHSLIDSGVIDIHSTISIHVSDNTIDINGKKLKYDNIDELNHDYDLLMDMIT